MEANVNMLQVAEVEKAVDALKDVTQKTNEGRLTRQLIEEEKVAMQFSFKKINIGKRQGIKIVLPHPPERDACLFVKDIDKKSRDFEKTKCAYEELLKENGIENLTIIPLKDLKINYTEFESKNRLSNMYEAFLADARIIRLLPAFLSSAFQKRNRYLLQVRLDSKDLKKEFEKVLSTTQCVLNGRGSTSQVVIGHITQDSESLAKNIVACFEAIQKDVPGGLQNIQNAQIKCGNSLAIPIYVSFDSRNDVELPSTENHGNEDEAEEVATVLNGKVRIRKGKIEIIKPEDLKRKADETDKPTTRKLKKNKN